MVDRMKDINELSELNESRLRCYNCSYNNYCSL